ncbi:MAG TPA: YceI family protein [Rhodocyclaceae bacterium]|nr:YceI family protein [Rhodocyclaceae bacterium]
MNAALQRLAGLGLALLCGSAAGEAVKYEIDPAHTFPSFEVSHLGFSVHRGRFNATRGTLILDRAARRGELQVVIDTASIDTGQEALEKALRSESFFDVAKFPEMRFQSSRLEFDGERISAVHGTLTIKGVARPLSLKIDHFHCGRQFLQPRPVCGANASARLLRSEFGIDKYVSLGLGDEVRIAIQVEVLGELAEAGPAN